MRKILQLTLVTINTLFALYWLTKLWQIDKAATCQTMALFSLAGVIIVTTRIIDKK